MVVLACSIATVQELRFSGQVDVLAAQAALGAGEDWHA